MRGAEVPLRVPLLTHRPAAAVGEGRAEEMRVFQVWAFQVPWKPPCPFLFPIPLVFLDCDVSVLKGVKTFYEKTVWPLERGWWEVGVSGVWGLARGGPHLHPFVIKWWTLRQGLRTGGATDASDFKGAGIQGGSHKEDCTARTQQSHPMSPLVKGPAGEGRGCWKGDAVAGEEPRRGRGLEWEGRRWDSRWAGPRASGEAVPTYLRTCRLGELGLLTVTGMRRGLGQHRCAPAAQNFSLQLG